MTKREFSVLQFMRRFIAEHGWCPSLQEIADAIGMPSKSNVHQAIQSLIAQGKVQRCSPGDAIRGRGYTLAGEEARRAQADRIVDALYRAGRIVEIDTHARTLILDALL